MVPWPLLLAMIWAGVLVALFAVSEIRLRRHGYRALRRPPGACSAHRFDPGRSLRLIGGARVSLMNATFPLVALTLDHEWARLGGLFNVWIPRAAVTSVHCMPALPLGAGILFRTDSGEFDGVVFWTFSPRQALEAFAWYGWPTEKP